MYAEIIAVTENSATLAFATGKPGFVSLDLEGVASISSIEAADCGRIEVRDLSPGTSYSGAFRGGNATIPVTFRTLPEPKGAEIDRLLLTADWHISLKKENRKGRFFVESAMLARETLEKAEALGATAVLIPGDLTNAGTTEEYEVAARILKETKIPTFIIPGNHDYPERGNWEKYIGKRTFHAELPGGCVIGIDTSGQRLHAEDAAAIEAELDRNGTATILSHYQLFEAPEVNHTRQLHIKNAAEFPRLFQKLTATDSIVWCGHQNICARTSAGKTLQVNLPQVPQWPCGSVLIRRCRNGNYYTFLPINSEVLRQWARTAGTGAAEFYREPQWLPEYRFADATRCNFFQQVNK